MVAAPHQMTVLHLAILGGHLDVVQYLVGAGADMNTKAHKGVSERDYTTDSELFHQRHLVNECFTD